MRRAPGCLWCRLIGERFASLRMLIISLLASGVLMAGLHTSLAAQGKQPEYGRRVPDKPPVGKAPPTPRRLPVTLSVSPREARLGPAPGTQIRFEVELPAWGAEAKDLVFWLEQVGRPARWEVGRMRTSGREALLILSASGAAGYRVDAGPRNGRGAVFSIA